MVSRAIREDPYETCELPRDLLEQHYSGKWLHKIEEIVLKECANELRECTMLDIGVGGGRTTFYFAPRVARYVGIDLNASMIEACRRNFPHLAENLIRCDARSMGVFPDGCFDFILFSFNGLDYLSPQDRLKALHEIRRVGKKGASFLFSSHNLNSVDRLFSLRARLAKNPRRLIAGLWKLAVLILMNRNTRKLKSKDFAVIYDGHGMFFDKLSWLLMSLHQRIGHLYYIKPHAQVGQLHSLGFTQVEVFSQDGRQIVSPAEMADLSDSWTHYRCRI
jgi:ubiquinone/menaquinone biosynthesis C-methylase UbiE